MKSLAIALLLFSMTAFAQEEDRPPFIQPMCDAMMVAKHKPTMTKEQYLEVIDVVHNMGGISDDYSTLLKGLIEEAYATDDLTPWVQKHCEGQIRGNT